MGLFELSRSCATRLDTSLHNLVVCGVASVPLAVVGGFLGAVTRIPDAPKTPEAPKAPAA